AQSLPVSIETAGNSATIAVDIGSGGEALSTFSALLEPTDGRFAPTSTEVKLDFDDVRGLSAANLGVSAERVGAASPALLSRMPDPQLVRLPHALPMLVTIQPSDRSGFAFNRTVEVEIHTHDLTYTPGSSYRLFKASPGEGFRDITSDIGPGSVRARGTTGGFSQFLIVEDLRDTRTVIAEKVRS